MLDDKQILSMLTMRELCNVQQVSHFWYCAGKENEVRLKINSLLPRPEPETKQGVEANTPARLYDLGSQQQGSCEHTEEQCAASEMEEDST